MDAERLLKRAIRLIRYRSKESVPTPIMLGQLLEGRCAFITGGSSGIGYAIAERFIAHGCRVVIAARDEAKLKNAVRSLGAENASYVVLDVENISTFDEVLDSAERALIGAPGFDIFVNSAGVHGGLQFGEITPEEWDEVIGTNLRAPFFMCQSAVTYMQKRGIRGHILMVGSASALKPGWSPYEISKRGVESLTQGVADIAIRHGIVVNCLAPGPVATPMLNLSDENELCSTRNPSGRFATPSEMANLAVVLVSSVGDLIVGSTLYATGGSGTLSFE